MGDSGKSVRIWTVVMGLLVYAADGQGAANGPLFDCADPAVAVAEDGSGYYVFSTGRGIPIWHSADLQRWTRIGRVFSTDTPPWTSALVPKARNVWAPDIAFFGGRYHLYYALSSMGSQYSAIGLAVSESLSPTSPGSGWTDRGPVLRSSPADDFNAIDPALFVDRDGKPYLFWGSYWSGIKAVAVDPASGLPNAEAQRVAIASRSKGVSPPAIEAPYVLFHEGAYWLFVSWDGCCEGADSTYKVMVGRAESVLGPYSDERGQLLTDGGGSLVLEGDERWRGPGHNSIVRTPAGLCLVHHVYDAGDIHAGRVLQIRPLVWQGGWPTAGPPLPIEMNLNRDLP